MKKWQYNFWRILIGLGVLFWGLKAGAHEAPFGYLYTTDSLPKGAWEYEQWQTARAGKARGDYFALDLRNEFEYGVTDRFTASLYVNSSFLHTNNVYDPEDVSQNLPDQSAYNIDSTSVELRYRVLSPYLDPIGLSFYLEPELGVKDPMTGMDDIERALEGRIILQKNFLDDLLVTAANIMVEPEWEIMDGMRSKELWVEFTLGASYRFIPKWSLGIEFRNHREFTNMDLGNQEHSAFFLGPNIHYGDKNWWATLTILPQIVGTPKILGVGADGKVIQSGYAYLAQHEKCEVRFKFGVNL